MKAEAFGLLKRDDESKDALRMALEIADETTRCRPNDGANWQRKAIILANLDRKDEAIESFNRAIDEADRSLDDNPGDVEALWLRAECLEILDMKAAAIRCYDQVIESNTSLSAGAWIRKAKLLAPEQYNESLLAYSKAFELMLGKNAGIPVSTVWEEDGFSVFTSAWFDGNQILLVSQGLYNQSSQSLDRYMVINTQLTSNWSIGADKTKAADILNGR
ncbi:MAG: Tetratricopeptide repeat protein [Methanosaeta sp. PtaU1.Bin028]|nr:MAG: Tetratricopeptide repeat protein [Methanosaeta sp. PtaU1.Bin028]